MVPFRIRFVIQSIPLIVVFRFGDGEAFAQRTCHHRRPEMRACLCYSRWSGYGRKTTTIYQLSSSAEDFQ